MVAEPTHEFWVDDLSLVSTDYFDPRRLQGPRQITDAHLLALAQRHDGQLVTFDRGIRDLVSTDRDECLLLLGS